MAARRVPSYLLAGRGLVPPISGEVASGDAGGGGAWSVVRDAFEANFARGREVGAQLVVYHRGRRVVDLCGGYANLGDDGGGGGGGGTPPTPLAPTHLACIFSSTKVLESLSIAMLEVPRQNRASDAPASYVKSTNWCSTASTSSGAAAPPRRFDPGSRARASGESS